VNYFRKETHLLNAPDVLFVRFAFPRIHRDTTPSNGSCCVILSWKYVTTRPLNLNTVIAWSDYYHSLDNEYHNYYTVLIYTIWANKCIATYIEI